MVTLSRTRTWKPSIPNTRPYDWSIRGRIRDQTPTSYNLRERWSFILNIPYRYVRSESAAEIGCMRCPCTHRIWIGLPVCGCSSGPHQHRPPSMGFLARWKGWICHDGPNWKIRFCRAGRTTRLCWGDSECVVLYGAELWWQIVM